MPLEINSAQFSRDLLNSLKSEVGRAINSSAADIQQDIQNLCASLLTNSPEYKAIASGILKEQLDIPNSDEALRDILSVVQNSIYVTPISVSTAGASLTGGLNIFILKNGIQDLIGLASGKYQGAFFEIPWLEWLLTKGDRILISQYQVNISSPAETPASSLKNGIAVMESGKGWRIPSALSGTENDNFITRTFKVGVIQNLLNDIVERRIKQRLS